ncbi:MAG TPA: outer membrane beta-barrel protein [Kofleriaceae bacterium]|nr:outer membrane beta-barrel protein [Kofleriaceae bacterium]
MIRTALSFALVLAALPAVATARPASRGFYAEAGLGALGMLGDAHHAAATGPVLALRLGYDLTSWASVGIAADASSHEATVPPPPEGEWFQLYQGRADVRLGVRAGPLALFADGGVGGAYMSSNILAKVNILDPGERASLALSAGGGLEYQLQNRHYAFGLAASYWTMPTFASLQGVEGRVFLRYTYGGSH